MSLFASAGKSNKQLGQRIKQVRSVLEHIGLYVGLAVYTAAGAKVKLVRRTYKTSPRQNVLIPNRRPVRTKRILNKTAL
jgi:hypothetical protein